MTVRVDGGAATVPLKHKGAIDDMRAHDAQPRWLTLMASLPASSVVERAGARRRCIKALIGSHAPSGCTGGANL
jgi:hypothetical protein